MELQYASLFSLLESTVERGQGNSILIQGPVGTGKTKLVEAVIKDLCSPHYVVKLDGYIHTDNKIALRAIIRQLNIAEGSLADDTMSFADRLSFVIQSLQGSQDSTPIIFVLDRIDLIATHTNQILLYNLFDIAQTSAVPIAVVGITARIDFTSLLEKRVKSRFSHRTVYTYPPSFKIYSQIAKSTLKLSPDAPLSDRNIKSFNSLADKLVKSTAFKENLQHLYDSFGDIPTLFKHCAGLVREMDDSGLCEPEFEELDARSVVVSQLSILELTILTAIQKYKKLSDKFNFELIYDKYSEYVRQLSRRGLGATYFSKPVALKAYEQLALLGIIKFEGEGAREYRMARSLTDITTEIEGLPQDLRKWIKTN